MNITWSRSETVLSNEDERVAIFKLSGSPTTVISQLTLSPVSVQDEKISCSAMAYYVAAHNSSMEITSVETKYFIHLNIEGKVTLVMSISIIMTTIDPDIMIYIMPKLEGNLTAGENQVLFCIVEYADSINPDIEYFWWHLNGNYTKTNSNMLSFSPLKLSDAGEYLCEVKISFPLLSSYQLTFLSLHPHIVFVVGKFMHTVFSFPNLTVTFLCSTPPKSEHHSSTSNDFCWFISQFHLYCCF